MKVKKCKVCNLFKKLEDFGKNKRYEDGLHYLCKECSRIRGRANYANNREKIAKTRAKLRKKPENIVKANERGDKWRKNNPEKVKKCKRRYYLNNREKILKKRDKYYHDNKEKVIQSHYDRKKNNINYNLSCLLRNRMNTALRNQPKKGSAVYDLGCSVEFFKKHLESKFYGGMNWSNYGKGKGKGSIDHIMPLSLFNLQDRQHFLLAAYYLNMQPLWWEDNIQKGNKIPFSYD